MSDAEDLMTRLTERFGKGVALRFSHEFGGVVLCVPGRAMAKHRIAEAVGLEVMRWIVAEFGPNRIPIPVADDKGWKALQRAARRAATSGLEAPAAARLVGVSQRAIHRHRAKARSAKSLKGPLL